MGSNQSSNTTAVLDDFTSATTNVIVNSTNTSSCGASSVNNDNVTFTNCNCDISIIQTAQSVCQNYANFATQNQTEILNSITQALSTMSSSQNSSTQGWLAAAINNQNSVSDVQQYVTTLLTNNLNFSTADSCVTSSVSENNGHFTFQGITCRSTGINLSQNASAAAVASCVMTQVTDILAQDQLMQQISAAADAADSSKQGGIAEAIAAIGGVISSASFVIIAIVIGIVAVAFILLKGLLSPQGSKLAERAMA